MDEEKLTRDTIVDEAIRLINDDGLDGVSLRKLAERVGVKAPSLYWYFKDKSALLAAVMERIFLECLESIPDHAEWEAWMHAFGIALWRTQATVRDFGRLVTTTDMEPAQLLRTTERIRAKVSRLNVAQSDAMEIQSAIQALMTGWSAFAHAPYARALSTKIDIDKSAIRDLEALIAGKAAQIAAKTVKRKRARV